MASDNPFSTRFIAPDCHHFVFPSGQSVAELGAQLALRDGWGQIIGPHGSGKSTLLQTLMHWSQEQGCLPRFFFLNDRQRQLPGDWAAAPHPRFYAVDGAEQLSAWAWHRLKWHCRRRRCGLLVTAHRSLGLPTLYQTAPATAETIRQVVQAIAGAAETPNPDQAQSLASHHAGDLRAILFELYDCWEARRPPTTMGTITQEKCFDQDERSA